MPKLNPEEKLLRHQDRMHNVYMSHKLNLFEFMGGVCVRCGFSDPRALQIDHVNGGGTRQLKSGTGLKYFDEVRRSVSNKENKYQLLCANCNWIKRDENNENRARRTVPREPINHYEEARAEVISALGGHCMTCGESRPVVLEFERLAGPLYPPVSWSVYFKMIIESAQAERNEYRLLCPTCRKIEHKAHA